MKVTHPHDLHGRLIHVEMRLRMVQESLDAVGASVNNLLLNPPSGDALQAFAHTIEEIADEVVAIQENELEPYVDRIVAARERIEAEKRNGAAQSRRTAKALR